MVMPECPVEKGASSGKVFKRDSTVFNVFVEPQWSVQDRGDGLPKSQIYFAVNMQFL